MPERPAAIVFHIDQHSGVPTYRQLVQQVEQSLLFGYLKPGDRLPAVRDVVRCLAINPNTVQKAYRDLEVRGLAAGRPGAGTFIERGLGHTPFAKHFELRRRLAAWLRDAYESGLDSRAIDAMFALTLRDVRDSSEGSQSSSNRDDRGSEAG